jgi:hypothetical protein
MPRWLPIVIGMAASAGTAPAGLAYQLSHSQTLRRARPIVGAE